MILRLLLLCCLILLACSSPSSNSNASCPNQGSLKLLASLTLQKIKEPSGIVYHQQRGSLFVVGDQGDIAELALDGTSRKSTNINKRDFEGITCNPQTGLLYVIEENKGNVWEIDPVAFRVRRKFVRAAI